MCMCVFKKQLYVCVRDSVFFCRWMNFHVCVCMFTSCLCVSRTQSVCVGIQCSVTLASPCLRQTQSYFRNNPLSLCSPFPTEQSSSPLFGVTLSALVTQQAARTTPPLTLWPLLEVVRVKLDLVSVRGGFMLTCRTNENNKTCWDLLKLSRHFKKTLSTHNFSLVGWFWETNERLHILDQGTYIYWQQRFQKTPYLLNLWKFCLMV